MTTIVQFSIFHTQITPWTYTQAILWTSSHLITGKNWNRKTSQQGKHIFKDVLVSKTSKLLHLPWSVRLTLKLLPKVLWASSIKSIPHRNPLKAFLFPTQFLWAPWNQSWTQSLKESASTICSKRSPFQRTTPRPSAKPPTNSSKSSKSSPKTTI